MSRDNRPHTTRNTAIAVLLVPCLTVVIVIGMALMSNPRPPNLCGTDQGATTAALAVDPKTVPAGPIAGFGHTQLVNAAEIMLAAQKLGLSVRDQEIGVMTAIDESGLIVLDHGDAVGPDSRGLFQQRDNGAWGSYADRMDPFISATNFFKAEMKIPDRDSLEPTIVAHRVQGNGDPYAYQQFWAPAQTIVQALAGVHPVTDALTGTTPTAAASTTSGGATHYATAGMRPQTVTVANAIGAMFHLKTIGGYRPMSSPYDDPLYGHSTGLAIDFMIDDIPNGTATGYAIANYLQQHAAGLGVQYIIYRQHIWAPYKADQGWRLMADRGDPTQNHMDHVHLSLNGRGGTEIPAPSGNLTSTTGSCTTDSDTGVPGPADLSTTGPCPLDQPGGVSCNKAIGWALGQQQAHDDWTEHCLGFVTTAYGGVWLGYGSAADAARALDAEGKITHTTNYASIPRGAVLWWTGGSHGYGHVAISIGGGNAISTDVPHGGDIGEEPIAWFQTHWGETWLGYSAPVRP